MRYVICPECKNDEIKLVGYEDGGGDFGDELTPIYECLTCEHVFSLDEAPKYFIEADDVGSDWLTNDEREC